MDVSGAKKNNESFEAAKVNLYVVANLPSS